MGNQQGLVGQDIPGRANFLQQKENDPRLVQLENGLNLVTSARIVVDVPYVPKSSCMREI